MYKVWQVNTRVYKLFSDVLIQNVASLLQECINCSRCIYTKCSKFITIFVLTVQNVFQNIYI